MCWLAAQDTSPAYRDYVFQLQVLQNQEPGRRWVLKSPAHWNNLAVWRDSFPDAYVIQTHRDMETVLPSLGKLLDASKKLYSHVGSEGRKSLPALRTFLSNRLEELKAMRQTLPADRQMDVSYESLVSDPAGIVRSVCHRFGIPFDAEAESAVARFIAENKRVRNS